MASAESSTSPTEGFFFDFDWADVESDLIREEPHGWDICHDYEELLDGECSEATGEASEINYEKDIKYITEEGIDEDHTNLVSIPSTEEVSSRERLLRGTEEEFRSRVDAIVHDEDIHHFNWLGNPVYQPSSTTAAESLAIICTGPKVSQGSDKWRVQSILDRAYQFLDPVVVSLENITQLTFNNRGSGLQNAAEGHVFKFYTPQGRWTLDPHIFDSGKVLLDTGSVDVYCNSSYEIGNGFIKPSMIFTRSDWRSIRRGIRRARQRSSLPRKITWFPPPPSPLSQSLTLPEKMRENPKTKP